MPNNYTFDSEDAFQAACFQWHWNNFPLERGQLWHTNNNSHNRASGSLAKGAGVVSGVADLTYLYDIGKVAFIELKVKGRPTQQSQNNFKTMVEFFGHKYFVIDSSLLLFQELIISLNKKRYDNVF